MQTVKGKTGVLLEQFARHRRSKRYIDKVPFHLPRTYNELEKENV